jgi:uncharacterized protein (TIGR02757 family)
MSIGGDLGGRLEALYAKWNRKDAVGPDPVGFVHRFADTADLEIVALTSACLAFGRVVQIQNSLGQLFDVLEVGSRPLSETIPNAKKRLRGFRHRFVAGENVAALLAAAQTVVGRHRSLGACFRSHLRDGESTTCDALARFVAELRSAGGRSAGFLFSRPDLGGACKRWHLLLRWMVRRDEVDVGLWGDIGTRRLVVPLDTHMFRIGRALGLTRRKTPDIKAALEVTAGFRRLCPSDPVRYDFALARAAMEGDPEVQSLLRPSLEGP